MSARRPAVQAAHLVSRVHAAAPFAPSDVPLARTLLRMRVLTQCVGLSRSQIYALAGEGKFPAPVKLASNLSVWPSHEVQEWIDARIAERDSAAAGGAP